MKLISRFATLFKRELVEHRKSVLYTPFIATGLIFLLILVSAIWNGTLRVNDVEFTARMLQRAAEQGAQIQLAQVHQGWMFGFFTLFHIGMGCVVFSYLLGCLFDERKDRSTLFWRSMPVNDWETVLSKLIVAVVLIPLIAWLALLLLQLLTIALFTVLCWQFQLDAARFIFQPIPFVHTQLWQLSSLFGSLVWTFPVVGWLMLCSAYAKQRPFLLAVLVPGVLALAAFLLNLSKLLTWAMGGRDLTRDIFADYFSRLGHLFIPFAGTSWEKSFDVGKGQFLLIEPIFSLVFSARGLIGFAIGAALIAATIWVRRYRESTAL
jgi:ABC-2 type transport system permease protein